MATKNETTIKVIRYDNPEVLGWEGYVESQAKSWILFFNDDDALFYPSRDADGGVAGEPTLSTQKGGQ